MVVASAVIEDRTLKRIAVWQIRTRQVVQIAAERLQGNIVKAKRLPLRQLEPTEHIVINVNILLAFESRRADSFAILRCKACCVLKLCAYCLLS